MGLRCLLGHDFTEPRTERDREERGDEVIISITEVKECKRCGETRVVSEKREVTSRDQLLEESGTAAATASDQPDTAAATASDQPDTAAATASDQPDTAAATAPADPNADDAEFIDADAADSGADPTAAADAGQSTESVDDAAASADADSVITDAESGGPSDDDFDHPVAGPSAEGVDTDVDEDAEILDEGPETADSSSPADAGDAGARAPPADPGEREHGEWPNADANRRGGDERPSGEATEWPDTDGEARENADGTSTAAASDEANRPAEGESEDVEFIDDDGPERWPEQSGEDEGYDAEVDDDTEDAGVSVDGNLTPQVDPEVARQEDVEFIEADAEATRTESPTEDRSPQSNADASTTERGPTGDSPETEPGRSDPAGGSTRQRVELQTSSDRVETVYVCPECGTRERVGASSMRAGDICPECHRGYIEERELE